MANEYIVAKRNDGESMGIIGLSLSVFGSIAAFCLEDIDGVELIASNRLKKAVIYKVEDNKIIITLNVNIKIGKNVNTISDEIQKHVAESISQITEFDDICVNVNVVGFYM